MIGDQKQKVSSRLWRLHSSEGWKMANVERLISAAFTLKQNSSGRKVEFLFFSFTDISCLWSDSASDTLSGIYEVFFP